MSEAFFVRFTEHNEWEGETWHFWIPMDGNSEMLDRLKAALGDSETYEVGNSQPEPAVDVLVASNAWDDNCSYMAAHTKLAGKLALPEAFSVDDDDPEASGLYKGGIRAFFHEAARDEGEPSA